MTLPLSGPLSLQDIRNEFGGTPEDQLTEYYRGGAYVPDVPLNVNIPKTGTIQIDDFYGSVKTTVVTYTIIGGGGAGGFGLQDGSGTGAAASGKSTSIVTPTQNFITAGGQGGRNGALSYSNYTTRVGQSSFYGVGGAGGSTNNIGQDAPITSYGAGGGGGGGDSGGGYDSVGNAGEGGFAGIYSTGSFTITYGMSVSVIIGSGGVGSGGTWRGGAGASGFCTLAFDGKIINVSATQNVVIL